jgi:SAM-dependent methyltransferase
MRVLFKMLSDFQKTKSASARVLHRFARVRIFTEQWHVHFFPRNANGLSVFDVGCGDGIFAERLAAFGMSVSGCEVDPIAAGRARAKRVNVIGKAFEDVPVGPESFDIITMIHVLEHFHNPVGMLMKAAAMLKKGGRLIVVVPNADSLSRHVFGEHWANWDVPRHLFHFSGDTLKSVCEKAGLQTMAIETRAHASIWIDSARSILGLKWLQDFGLPPFNRAERKVHHELCIMLNDMARGDHLAGCFMKPA